MALITFLLSNALVQPAAFVILGAILANLFPKKSVELQRVQQQI